MRGQTSKRVIAVTVTLQTLGKSSFFGPFPMPPASNGSVPPCNSSKPFPMSREYPPVHQLKLPDLTRSYSMLQHHPTPTTSHHHGLTLRILPSGSNEVCAPVGKVASKDSTRKHVNSPEPSAQWFHCIPSAPTPTSGACLDLNISELSLFLHGGSYILAFALPCVAAGIKITGNQWSNHLPKGICARILKLNVPENPQSLMQWLNDYQWIKIWSSPALLASLGSFMSQPWCQHMSTIFWPVRCRGVLAAIAVTAVTTLSHFATVGETDPFADTKRSSLWRVPYPPMYFLFCGWHHLTRSCTQCSLSSTLEDLTAPAPNVRTKSSFTCLRCRHFSIYAWRSWNGSFKMFRCTKKNEALGRYIAAAVSSSFFHLLQSK